MVRTHVAMLVLNVSIEFQSNDDDEAGIDYFDAVTRIFKYGRARQDTIIVIGRRGRRTTKND